MNKIEVENGIEKKIPLRYKNASYDSVHLNVKEKFESIRTTRNGLYIHGGVGCGKTHIAYSLYRKTPELVNVTAYFWNVSELLREIKLDYGRDNKSKEFFEDKVMNCQGVLFLDDIGSEKMTEWVEEMFYLIVNKRYNDMLPTVFTSNLSIQELANRVGDRIVSRIVGSCEIIKIEGDDRRLVR